MTLEDFFTLTEMKDGLTASSRVQELITVMKKEQDCVVKNAGDAIRQWAAVASTIAATQNKDCLDLFIRLDGVWYINRWLNDAQNFVVDEHEGLLEESITAMLRAVEKLYQDCEMSISSEIRVTVSNLLGHQSSKVQDRARVLFSNWKEGGNGDTESHETDICKMNNVNDKIGWEEVQLSSVKEANNDDDKAAQLVGGEKSQLRSSDSQLQEKVASVQIQSSDDALQSSVSLGCEDAKERSNHLASVSASNQQVTPMSEAEMTSSGTCNLPVPKQGSCEGQPDDLQINNVCKKEKQNQTDNGPPEKLGTPDISLAPINPETVPVSIGANEAPIKPESGSEHVEGNDDGVCHKIIVSGSMRTPAPDSMSDTSAINSGNPQLPRSSENSDGCCSDTLQDLSISGIKLEKAEVKMSILETEHGSAVKEEGKGQFSNQDDKTSNGSDSFKRWKATRSPLVDKISDIELEYGTVDALEFARQVAQEVQRDIHSSSSEKISEGRIRRSSSTDSISKKDELAEVKPEEVSSRQSNSAEACSEEEGLRNVSDDIVAEPECIPDLESSQVTEAARDPGGYSEKSLCTFDLNEEVGSDDLDVSANSMTTAPISVVSASKPAQTSGLLTAPLQFEGTLGGWKGSAATSAFRPASPRKKSDSEKNVSVGGGTDISKQRQVCLDIDLNVAEGEEGLVKQIGQFPDLPSGQSSEELSPKRPGRFELDLNSVGDDGDTQPSNHRMEGKLFPVRNGYWSPSPASSSSSMQPYVRNIDLNDRPFFQTDLVDQGPAKSSPNIEAYGHPKSAPMISILGAKVEVARREYVPQNWSLPNGKAIEPAIDLTMSGSSQFLGLGPVVSDNHSTVFGYNQLTSTPPPLSFSSAMYGSGGTIPYMVDSRGAPAVPQVGGSTVLSSYNQPPFIMSMTGTQLGLNGVGSSHPHFDLNSGFLVDGGNRDALAGRPFFFPAQGRAMEEHVRSFPQSSSSSVVSGKRKEPDGGWETYPPSYKHQQPPWK
ncbi:uncharacterized protein LOC130716801 [Lotus japonicus]|uniref:uncharacterized protein LOC130716801 n=1 Tax=Lotus japonicus TaxID=34305 RepID=UPI0025834ABD|nr:uncharacterized protein LOC130716801 [Lotus japonicus]